MKGEAAETVYLYPKVNCWYIAEYVVYCHIAWSAIKGFVSFTVSAFSVYRFIFRRR